MALSTTFNRLKREIGIKKCVIVEGNIGDVYLNEKKQIVDLKQYLMDMLKAMDYDDVLYWDRIDGVDGDVSRLDVVDKVEVEGDDYSFDDDEEETPKEEQKTGSGLFKEPAEIFNIIFKNLKKPNKKIAFVLNWADYLFSAGGQLPPDERELLTLLGKAIKDKKVDYLSSEVNESTVVLITSKLSMFPISFYQGNPEVACLTLSRPDREEREKMLPTAKSFRWQDFQEKKAKCRLNSFTYSLSMAKKTTLGKNSIIRQLKISKRSLPSELSDRTKRSQKSRRWS